MGPFSSRPRLSVFTFLWLASPLFATILWLFLLMGVLLLPNLLVPLVSVRTAAGQLLHICQLWYVVLVLVLLAGFPIIFLTGLFACQRLENVPGTRKMPALVLVCLTFPCIFAYGIVIQEDLPSKFLQAREDLAQIESNFLVEAEVWISPKARPANLPGPYSGSLTAQPITRYGIIGDDTGGQWLQVYVPNAMGFSLDQDRLYNENLSIQWNQENARRYRVRYTSNFHLVAEITPIEG